MLQSGALARLRDIKVLIQINLVSWPVLCFKAIM
jgi:hypothetical protein